MVNKMLKQLKLVIFDLDQTLVNTVKRMYVIYNQARKELGLNPVDWETFYYLFEHDKLSYDVPESLLERLWDILRSIYCSVILEEDGPIDGAEGVLKLLKEKNIIVVVTTGRRCSPEDIWKELYLYGLAEYVDDVYTAIYSQNEDIPFERSTVLKMILEKYSVSSNEAIFVADYFPDMYAGKKVGILTIGVKTGLKQEKDLKLHGADYVLNSISELPELLRRIGAL